MKSMAIIPARSGSKGLKDKNIKELCGKPMLAYTVEAAVESGIYDCIHVSTDSMLYAETAMEYGAEVPFLRSDVLASDTAGSWDVVRWTLAEYQKIGREFDVVTLLQPTSPLRNANDIQRAYALMEEKKAQAIISVCEMEHSPLWSNTLLAGDCMDGFLRPAENVGRQQLPDYYRVNGAIYMLKTSLLMQKDMNLYGKDTYAYRMPRERSIDIDDELDFWVAETIMKKQELV